MSPECTMVYKMCKQPTARNAVHTEADWQMIDCGVRLAASRHELAESVLRQRVFQQSGSRY